MQSWGKGRFLGFFTEKNDFCDEIEWHDFSHFSRARKFPFVHKTKVQRIFYALVPHIAVLDPPPAPFNVGN